MHKKVKVTRKKNFFHVPKKKDTYSLRTKEQMVENKISIS